MLSSGATHSGAQSHTQKRNGFKQVEGEAGIQVSASHAHQTLQTSRCSCVPSSVSPMASVVTQVAAADERACVGWSGGKWPHQLLSLSLSLSFFFSCSYPSCSSSYRIAIDAPLVRLLLLELPDQFLLFVCIFRHDVFSSADDSAQIANHSLFAPRMHDMIS